MGYSNKILELEGGSLKKREIRIKRRVAAKRIKVQERRTMGESWIPTEKKSQGKSNGKKLVMACSCERTVMEAKGMCNTCKLLVLWARYIV